MNRTPIPAGALTIDNKPWVGPDAVAELLGERPLAVGDAIRPTTHSGGGPWTWWGERARAGEIEWLVEFPDEARDWRPARDWERVPSAPETIAVQLPVAVARSFAEGFRDHEPAWQIEVACREALEAAGLGTEETP